MRQPRFFAIFAAAYLMGIGLTGLAAQAQTFVPPDRGMPGRRQGGGTRGGNCQGQPALTALMPDTNYGQTLSPHPTWLWYVPQNSAESIEFVLTDGSRQIYKTTVQPPQQPGVVSVSLPSSLPPLTVGTDYHWYFLLLCDIQDPSGDIFTGGWVRRIEPDAALARQLQTAEEAERLGRGFALRPTLYAQSGIWQDALSTLATLHRQQPENAAITQQWQTLLGSVGLEEFADQPLLEP